MQRIYSTVPMVWPTHNFELKQGLNEIEEVPEAVKAKLKIYEKAHVISMDGNPPPEQAKGARRPASQPISEQQRQADQAALLAEQKAPRHGHSR